MTNEERQAADRHISALHALNSMNWAIQGYHNEPEERVRIKNETLDEIVKIMRENIREEHQPFVQARIVFKWCELTNKISWNIEYEHTQHPNIGIR